MKKLFSYLLPILAYAGLIFALSSQSQLPEMPSGQFDKLAHCIEYAILAWLLARAQVGYSVEVRRAWRVAVALSILYAASDEFHQMYTPHRAPELLDFLADSAGAILGASLFVGFLNLGKKQEPSP